MEIDLEKAKISKMLIKTKLLKFDLDLKKREMVDSEKAKKISPAKNLLKKSLTIQTVLGLIAISAGGLGFLKALDEYEAYKEFRENENRITFKDDLIKLAEGLEKDSTGLTITFLTYFGKDAIPILLHELEIKRNRDEVFAAIKAILHSSESQRENTIKIILINATRFFDKEARKKQMQLISCQCAITLSF